MAHFPNNRAIHLLLLSFLPLLLTSANSLTAAIELNSSTTSSKDSSSCDPSSQSCPTHLEETSTGAQRLADWDATQASVDPSSTDLHGDGLRNQTDNQQNSTSGQNEGESSRQSSGRFHLKLPSLKLPHRDFFSISDRINALRNLFQSVINLDRELIWNPVVPSRTTRGNFLVRLFSSLLAIMPFHEFAEQVREGITSRTSCLMCNILANIYTSRLFPPDIVAYATQAVCVMFRLQTPRVCRGVVNTFRSIFEFVRLNSLLNPSEMCGVFMGSSCALRASDKLNWTINIPDRKDKKMTDQERDSSGIPIIPTKDILSLHDFGDPNLLQHESDPAVAKFHHQDMDHQHHLDDSCYHQESSGNRLDQDFAEYEENDSIGRKRIRKTAPKAAAVTFKVLQLTDLHFDPYFTPGSRTDCGEPVCCRSSNGPAMSLATMAGIWGEYTDCDTPFFTIENALQRVSQEHPDVSYWLMTGDLQPHDIWEYNRNETIAHIKFNSWLINHHSRDIGVFPVIGNHEAVPINSFAPPDISDKEQHPAWLYESAAVEWSGWLPIEALETFRRGGHYSVRVKPGFRIISVNSNYCARLNPWVLYDPVDPGRQLEWLRDELLSAEESNDRVHLIGHVPPDHRECTESWLFNYIRLMERFSDTIKAQFYGHTHRDEFRVVYALNDTTESRPVAFQFICPSITSYSQTNPAYRIYEVDTNSYEVITYKTYFFDLKESNSNQENQRPKWKMEYEAGELFNITSVTPQNMDQILKQLQASSEKFQEYFRRFYVQSDAEIAKTWDAGRRDHILKDHSVTNPFTRKPGSILPAFMLS